MRESCHVVPKPLKTLEDISSSVARCRIALPKKWKFTVLSTLTYTTELILYSISIFENRLEFYKDSPIAIRPSPGDGEGNSQKVR